MPAIAPTSIFDNVTEAPPDKILNLSVMYKADTDATKVDLGVGAYRDNNGKPWVLPAVKEAKRVLSEDPSGNHEYLGVGGVPELTSGAAKLIFGKDSPALADSRVYTIQSISGTGALMVGAQFLAQFKPVKDAPVYISDPTWANHRAIFETAGHTVKTYAYCDFETLTLNINGMIKDLKEATEGSIVILHACAHNPTGIDPTHEQWEQIASVMAERKLIPFFDTAYQGFATGSLDNDAWAIRRFVDYGFEMLVAESFAKNMGLYGERTGCLHTVSNSQEITRRISTQINRVSRATISTASAHGGKIAGTILKDSNLFSQWLEDLKTMSDRIKEMRDGLRTLLEKLGTPGTWNHITDQIGMFSFTGLNATQAEYLKNKYHIYLTDNGRISLAGLNTSNLDYVARAIDDVVRNVPKN
ncbi:Aspartate aminotransferase, cytoplasmic [Mycoemilia scoparia]|uniref:aspartate transaminase n=1 Tax=Mycoemilia scoparia TaxID=417184 RepID=A0A9W8A2C3_9FUNG|nr:Aspartate aminotransferase, cytoplasmic [Mycoemilia scoparia]